MSLNVATNLAGNMEVKWHFAIPIYARMLSGFDEHKEGLLSLLRELHHHAGHAKAWHSEPTLHLNESEHIQWLNRHIGDLANSALQNFHNKAPLDNVDIVLTAMWAKILGTGAFNGPHNHFPSHWSGVFYLDVENTINAADPMDKGSKLEFFNPVPLAASFGLPNSVLYTPRDGLLLLFPSALQHMAHPVATEAERVSISFNLTVAPRQPQG